MRLFLYATLAMSLSFTCAVGAVDAGTYTTTYTLTGKPDGAIPNGNLVSYGGKIFFTTSYGGAYDNGAVIVYDPGTGTETVLHSFGAGSDGQRPVAGLTLVGSTLYGTTIAGGDTGNGAVFEINPLLGSEAVLYSFT